MNMCSTDEWESNVRKTKKDGINILVYPRYRQTNLILHKIEGVGAVMEMM